MRCKRVLVILVLTVFVSWSDASRILIAGPSGTKSHQNVYIPIAKELIRRGHQVTVITNYLNDELTKLENVEQIWLETLAIDPSLFPNPFSKPTSLFEKLNMFVKVVDAILNYPTKITETTFSDERVKKLMTNGHFDLVIISEACGLSCFPLGWHFKAPTILFSPNVLFPGRAKLLGDDDHHSYVPFLLSSFTDQMTLYQRTINYLLTKLFYFTSHDLPINTVHSIIKRMVNPDCPQLEELEKNFSLVLTNSHPVFNFPRVLPPQVVEVGGIHCRPANPLPDDLEKFVSESKDGFIMFGVGSALQMEDVPEEVVQSIMKAFSRLPQRVIWQWKGKVRPDLPKNVLAISWLPQQDLLGHTKCKAFLTHGGLNSLQEAVFHAVPVLGFPSGSDQTININRAVKEGYAVKLDWIDLTEETLFNSIKLLVQNSSYKESAVRVSRLFRDQLQTPLERAVYWTEFVLRHNGTNHLRLGSVDLAPYQRALIDVYFVLFISALVPLLLSVFCIKKCCCRRSVNAEKKHQ